MVTFVLERDIGEAAEDVREKVQQAIRKLPPNVLPPTVMKADPDSDPVITLSVNGNRSIRELTEIADKTIRRAIETVDGVGGVDISGAQNRQINVYLDLDKLNAYNMSAQEVQRAVQTENVETPGGRIVRGPTEVGVRTLGRVEHVEEFNNIIVKNVNGAPIRIRDVGRVEDGMSEKRTFAYYKGKPAVVLEVRRQIGTNTVKVVEDIQKKLASIKATLPAGVNIDTVKEQATYIKASVAALEEHLILGSLLASFIVWLFIRDWRMVLISSVAIPTSIITTFTVMRMMDFSLNSMTLLGLTLAVGIVIDDAIIVLENIYRFIQEKGQPPMQAAVEATKEIALAVMATTLSLVIIFVPIAFTTGYAKRFMNQFGWTMAISIMVSMLVAFTLTPTLSARLLGWRRKREDFTAHEHKVGPHGARLYRECSAGRWRIGRRLSADLRRDARFHVRHQQVHRPRLDAAGRPERTRRLPGDAGRLVAGGDREAGARRNEEAGRDSRGHRGNPGIIATYGSASRCASSRCC